MFVNKVVWADILGTTFSGQITACNSNDTIVDTNSGVLQNINPATM